MGCGSSSAAATSTPNTPAAAPATKQQEQQQQQKENQHSSSATKEHHSHEHHSHDHKHEHEHHHQHVDTHDCDGCDHVHDVVSHEKGEKDGHEHEHSHELANEHHYHHDDTHIDEDGNKVTITQDEVVVTIVEESGKVEEIVSIEEKLVITAPDSAVVEEKPAAKMGWLSKQGHVVKNWKRRWFVLDAGKLSYYEEPANEKPYGKGEKGTLILNGGTLDLDDKRILLRLKGEKEMLMEAESPAAAKAWATALAAHVEYYCVDPAAEEVVPAATTTSSVSTESDSKEAKEVAQVVPAEVEETKVEVEAPAEVPVEEEKPAEPEQPAAVEEAQQVVESKETTEVEVFVEVPASEPVEPAETVEAATPEETQPAAQEEAVATEVDQVQEIAAADSSDSEEVKEGDDAAKEEGDRDSDEEEDTFNADSNPKQLTKEKSYIDEAAAANASATPAKIPDLMTGWMSKQGHLVKNWKRRWFVLSEGTLSYYEEPLNKAPWGINRKGEVPLTGMKLVIEGKRLHLQVQAGGNNSGEKELLMEAQSDEVAKSWEGPLREHIAFASKRKYSDKHRQGSFYVK